VSLEEKLETMNEHLQAIAWGLKKLTNGGGSGDLVETLNKVRETEPEKPKKKRAPAKKTKPLKAKAEKDPLLDLGLEDPEPEAEKGITIHDVRAALRALVVFPKTT